MIIIYEYKYAQNNVNIQSKYSVKLMNGYAYIGYPTKSLRIIIYRLHDDVCLTLTTRSYPKETIDAFRTSVGLEMLLFANIIPHIILILNTILYVGT